MIRCQKCRKPLTWAQQRVQFGRLTLHKLDADTIRAVLPRCQKCVTVHLDSLANTDTEKQCVKCGSPTPHDYIALATECVWTCEVCGYEEHDPYPLLAEG